MPTLGEWADTGTAKPRSVAGVWSFPAKSTRTAPLLLAAPFRELLRQHPAVQGQPLMIHTCLEAAS